MSILSDKIKTDFAEFSKSDRRLQQLIRKLENGNATLADVDAFTQAASTALKKAFEKNIAENAAAFVDEELLAEVLRDTLGDNCELINSVAENVQKQLDKAAGINIRPQRAAFPADRIENLARVTAQKDLTDKTALSEFGAAIENISSSIFADHVKANADFRSKAGLKVYVIRTDHGGCCEWCAKLAGKYVYPDVPKDVWRRHKRCTCEITYVNEKAGTYDKISYSDRKDGGKLETQKQITKLTPEQALQREQEVLKRLDKNAKNDTIKIDMQYFAKKSSDFKTVKLPTDEYAHVMSEIATHISEEQKSKRVFSKPIGNHMYLIENNGFGNYRIIGKKKLK